MGILNLRMIWNMKNQFLLTLIMMKIILIISPAQQEDHMVLIHALKKMGQSVFLLLVILFKAVNVGHDVVKIIDVWQKRGIGLKFSFFVLFFQKKKKKKKKKKS